MSYEEIKQKYGAQVTDLRNKEKEARSVVEAFQKAFQDARKRELDNYPKHFRDNDPVKMAAFRQAQKERITYENALKSAQEDLNAIVTNGTDFSAIARDMINRESGGRLSHPVAEPQK